MKFFFLLILVTSSLSAKTKQLVCVSGQNVVEISQISQHTLNIFKEDQYEEYQLHKITGSGKFIGGIELGEYGDRENKIELKKIKNKIQLTESKLHYFCH